MEALEQLGYVGLFIGSFLASTIVPFSSEVLFSALLLTGLNPYGCLIVASLGNTLGGMTSYGLGYLGKWSWLEKYFKVKQDKVEVFKTKVERYGVWASTFTWLPVVGDLISISLGFFKASPWKVTILMLIGRGLRYLAVLLVLKSIL